MTPIPVSGWTFAQLIIQPSSLAKQHPVRFAGAAPVGLRKFGPDDPIAGAAGVLYGRNFADSWPNDAVNQSEHRAVLSRQHMDEARKAC
jgi:hypothetical protein